MQNFAIKESIRKMPKMHKFQIILILNTILISTVYSVSHPKAIIQEKFSYNNQDTVFGPNSWREVCITGRRQSPIEIKRRGASTFFAGYTQFQFNEEYIKPQHGFFSTGLNFQIQFDDDKENPTSDLIFSGAGLRSKYTFSQLHFHWGNNDTVGSEHVINGQRYPLEIHIVHYKSKYGNLTNALENKIKDDRAVAVFAVVFQLGNENAALSSIISAAESIRNQNVTSEEMPYHTQSLNIIKLLPPQLDFVRYLGSLSTPPCTEKVVWTVFLSPSTVATSQLQVLRELSAERSNMTANFRSLQNLNGRILKYYKVRDSQKTELFQKSENKIKSKPSLQFKNKFKESFTKGYHEIKTNGSNFSFGFFRKNYLCVNCVE